jgi:hypothetical protein
MKKTTTNESAIVADYGLLWRDFSIYEGVSKSFRTGRLERELQMAQLSATRRSCIISWVILVSFAAITLRVASRRVLLLLLFPYQLSLGIFGYTLVDLNSLVAFKTINAMESQRNLKRGEETEWNPQSTKLTSKNCWKWILILDHPGSLNPITHCPGLYRLHRGNPTPESRNFRAFYWWAGI